MFILYAFSTVILVKDFSVAVKGRRFNIDTWVYNNLLY